MDPGYLRVSSPGPPLTTSIPPVVPVLFLTATGMFHLVLSLDSVISYLAV
jgi:hypothetical protein